MLDHVKTGDVLAEVNKPVHSVKPGDKILDAISYMTQNNLGAVLVMTNDRLDGILSERDVTRKMILRGMNPNETKVTDIMSKELTIVHPDDPVMESLAIMTEKKIRHLPVMNDKKVFGLISMREIVQKVVTEQHVMIKQLESYISGAYMA